MWLWNRGKHTESKRAGFSYQGNYTYADYLQWTIQERLELIRGKIFLMSPAPSTYHQRVSQRINKELLWVLDGKPCAVFTAPFDVRLPHKSPADEEVETMVQPDLCVVCDSSKIDARGYIGAPDIVIETLSPSNSKMELKHK